MALNVLKILGLLAVDVARQVEIEVIFFDLLDRDHARIFWDFEPPVEDIDDLVNVLGTKAILGAVLHKAHTGIDHEDALAGVSVLFVDNNDAGGDSGAVEEISGQSDDALDVAPAN